MVRYKLFLLPILCLMFFAQSCIHGDLDDCPPMVKYAVAFKYTNHTDRYDRFYDDVKKINLYVFDENNLIYTTTTELSPYEENFNIPLDLPMGNYHIIAWGNVLDSQPFSVTSYDGDDENAFIKGKTTIEEARLILQRNADNLSQTELEKLFYGELDVEVPLYISSVDTIPLMNNTNHVRVVLHWDHSGAVRANEETVNYDDVSVRIYGGNADYDFDNKYATNKVVYAPYAIDTTGLVLNRDRRSNWLNIFYYPDSIDRVSDSTVYDFKILRMMVDHELKLAVLRKNAVEKSGFENLFIPIDEPNRDDVDYGVDIIGNSAGTLGFTKLMRERLGVTSPLIMQNTFDMYENYRIDVYFRYDELKNTYISAVVISVEEWHLVKDGGHGNGFGGAD